MLLVDVVLRAIFFLFSIKCRDEGPLWRHYSVSLRATILDPSFDYGRLLHFEEKVHMRRLARADSMPLLFPRLLCHVLAHMGFPADPRSEPAAIVERASLLTNGSDMAPSPVPRTSRAKESPSCSVHFRPSTASTEAASSDAPPVVPLHQSRHYYPWSEYRALLASFQTLTTTQTAIMERMDHFSFSRTNRLSFSVRFSTTSSFNPAPPVAVLPQLQAEDPSYPPEELLLDHTIISPFFYSLLSGGITSSFYISCFWNIGDNVHPSWGGNSHTPSGQTTSEDVFSEDERLNFWFLGVMEARMAPRVEVATMVMLASEPVWISNQFNPLKWQNRW
ncbi:hypothetical protein CK203_020027 [Vitis vinifera]|uniref:Uncharacterized protein n=1 Tax=Vitis vinifera TaxID=29760 RepID=A0A438J2S5_VITVI|nr:hypothetical protein CK203_020027 [Vitis vinifera]